MNQHVKEKGGHRINRLAGRMWIGIAVGLVLGIGWLGGSAISQENKVVIVSWGGDYQAALREAYWTPFEKETGIKVIEDTRPLPPKIKAMVESGKMEWDIVDHTASQYMEVHKIGGFEPIDYKKLDPKSLSFIDREGQKHDAVMHQMVSVGIAYRTDVFKTDHPKSWADFWNVKRFPGPRALGTLLGAGAYLTLEAALLADGVLMDKLYPLDVERAFRKLKELKPHVSKWTDTAAMPQQLLVDKEVVMAAAFSARTYIIKEKGAPIDFVWNQAGASPMFLAIPKGAPNKENAHRLINFMLKEENQVRYGNIYYYGVANKKAYDKIPTSRARCLTTYPENFKVQFVQDADWWGKNASMVNERWSKWILE